MAASSHLNRVTLSSNEKIGLIGNLATMLAAGIPIHEAVLSLQEDSKGNERKVLETLSNDLMQGKHVYSSFSNFPRVFDKVTVNLIRASEEAGTLETVLRDLRDNIQKEEEFIDKIKFAMIYPLFILLVFLGVLVMILIVVIPKFAAVFTNLNVELPWYTQILITASNLLLDKPLQVIAGLCALIFIISWIFRNHRDFLLQKLYSLPFISRLVKEVDITRFSRNLYLLLSSGIPITSALELTQDVVVRKQTTQLIIKSREMVSSGKKLSEGLRSIKGVMPTLIIKLIEAGEKTGTLDKSMAEIANYLDYQVSKTLKVVTTILEPAMLIVVGFCVGGMIMAIIGPIYGFIGQVGVK
jgi:type IV pilus assembly protein PilC